MLRILIWCSIAAVFYVINTCNYTIVFQSTAVIIIRKQFDSFYSILTRRFICDQLQQFRQKKDNKGNTSKSSGKSSNSGHDASTNAPSEPVPKPNKVAVRERSGHDAEYHIPLSESTDDLSAKTGIFGTTELVAGTVKFPLEDSGVAETKWDNSSGDGHDDVDLSIPHGGRYSSIHPEDVDHNMSGTLDLVVPKEESTESSISLPIGFSSHPEKKHGEEQVTDVGLCLHF